MARKALTAEQEDLLVRNYRAGASLEVAASKYGCSAGTARNALLRRGAAMRPCGPRPTPVPPERICSRCKLPKTDFYGEGRHTSVCIDCTSEKAKLRYHTDTQHRQKKIESAKRWVETHPSRVQTTKRRRYSGWTSEQFLAAWEGQRGQCAICGVDMLESGCFPTSVCADHDHQTGDAGGLLCRQCNMHLGIYEQRQEGFEAYLQRYPRRILKGVGT
jgi:hypothetical protein